MARFCISTLSGLVVLPSLDFGTTHLLQKTPLNSRADISSGVKCLYFSPGVPLQANVAYARRTYPEAC